MEKIGYILTGDFLVFGFQGAIIPQYTIFFPLKKETKFTIQSTVPLHHHVE